MTQPLSDHRREQSEANSELSTVCVATCVVLFALGGALTLVWVPFPTAYDELQHLSFIRAMRDAPTLFPHYGTYHVLGVDLQGWTDAINYIAHPPLYYLLLAPFSDHVVVLRLINLAMATTGFALCALAGMKLLATNWQRYGYLALLLFFSKPALIAGMINNDNLVLLETGLLFWLLASRRGQPIACAAVLAAVGWTKFNAFVGLTLWVGLFHGLPLLRSQERLFGKANMLLGAGALVGALPALHNLATLGVVAYVPLEFLYTEPSLRPTYDLYGFIAAFFGKIGRKTLFMDGVANVLPAVIAIVAVGAFAWMRGDASMGKAHQDRKARDVAGCAWLATLAFATLHVVYGWDSFRTLGSMSDAQSRYYAMLWPGVALAAVFGTSALVRRIQAVVPIAARAQDGVPSP